ncbi:MAG: hypothetical protein HY360_18715 [Verrucomicrobia bacterium]|nr:hypothetical protein [Verrucomicrobiota bacterium]
MGFTLQTAASRVFLWQRANQAIFLSRNILLAWFISPAGYGDFIPQLLPRILGMEMDRPFPDIGTPEAYRQAAELDLNGLV